MARDGRCWCCAVKKRERSRRYYEATKDANREERLAKQRIYNIANREKRLEYARSYREAHREKLREQARDYYENLSSYQYNLKLLRSRRSHALARKAKREARGKELGSGKV
jgi:hypothetical protein